MKWNKSGDGSTHRLRLSSGFHIASVGTAIDGTHWWLVFGIDAGQSIRGEASSISNAKHRARNAVKLALDIMGLEERQEK